MASENAPPTNSLAFYEPRPTVKHAAVVGLQSAGVGALVSTVQNALGTHNRGAMGVFTQYGGTIGFFAAMGATFAATESVVANMREKNDPINGAAGGCAAGFLAGLRARSLPVAVASCAFLGAAVGTFDASGQLAGEKRELDSPESWEERRRRFFKQKPTAEFPTDS
ncbi:hypothetical protein M0805_002334 [Coniferiporia weirii]|nr:hypothetical protein M0805_002334 [Coniferiporia weirii]